MLEFRLADPPRFFRLFEKLERGINGGLLPCLFAKLEIADQCQPVLLTMDGRQAHLLECITPVRKPDRLFMS